MNYKSFIHKLNCFQARKTHAIIGDILEYASTEKIVIEYGLLKCGESCEDELPVKIQHMDTVPIVCEQVFEDTETLKNVYIGLTLLCKNFIGTYDIQTCKLHIQFDYESNVYDNYITEI